MLNLVPIILFVYNRPTHTQKTIEALQKNTLASQSELFIFADGPKNENDKNVIAVRKYLKTITGFKKITIFESKNNKGLANSIINGVTKIINRYGKVIVLEDDIVTSPYFLQFMNDALEMYQSDEQVACISGYAYPLKGKLPQSFFIRGADCWGWATWKRAWDIFEPNGQKLLDEIKDRKLEKDFNFNNSYPYTQMLRDQINGKNDSWAIRWLASAYLKNKLCLYLGQSIVQNIGFDGSGTHCEKDNNYKITINKNAIKLKKIFIEENKMMRRRFVFYFRNAILNKIGLRKYIFRKSADRTHLIFLNRWDIGIK